MRLRWRPGASGHSAHRTGHALAIVLVLVAGLLPALADILRLWHDRDAVVAARMRDTENLVAGIAQHSRDTFRHVDLALIGLVERIQTDGASPPALARLGQFLVTVAAAVPAISLIAYADETGAIRAASAPLPDGLGVGDRPYFLFHHETPGSAPHLAAPLAIRQSSQTIIPYSRRIDHPDGSFAGIVFAGIDPAYFRRHFERLNLGPQTTVTLIGGEGRFLASWPSAATAATGDIHSNAAFQHLAQGEPGGTLVTHSAIDGVARLISYRKLASPPFVAAAAAMPMDEVLDPWRSRVAGNLSGTVGLSLATILLGVLLLRQSRARTAAATTLARREAEYRLLAENSSDVVLHVGPDGICRYASPACRELSGHAPEDLVGHPIDDHLHPDHHAEWAASVASPPAARVRATYRARRRDGTYFWVEAHRHHLPGNQGYIAALRDISDRKEADRVLHQARAELEAANRRLERQARQDGLTGLANRRHLDEALDREFRRARREQQPLSLILIDIDHFKRFNDTYGHPAGDACLRLVAEAVMHQASRPADLAARYGGEELAILLPGTPLCGALPIAQQVRAAVHSLAIPHAASPHGIVTASIGVAELTPSTADPSPEALIHAADQSLYRAKAAGRDTIGVPGPSQPVTA